MNWKDKPVLVTGAGGFIGSQLVEALARQGAQVRAFLRYNSRADIGLLKFLNSDYGKNVEVTLGDIRDSSAILTAMKDCDVVFHLGALIAIPYSYAHPREVVETNVMGTLNILEAARITKPSRVIHTSTSEVYGTAQYIPINETHPLQGQSPYSASKIGADKIVESYHRSFGLPTVTVRPFNTYGPRQSARAVIPTIITQALAKDAVQLGELNSTRDFTFVDDTVRGFLCAAEAPNIEGHEINLGNKQEISVGDLAKMIIQMIGRDVAITCESERLRPARSEVFRLYADNSLAHELMGWQPLTTLEVGLAKTIAWIKEHLDLYRVGTYQI
ncbi:MAG TPA: SDR family NAD(P)-dependent oxidoreductase [Blastocatellia bacterium]|nr:SDR family NAD(P)-dependent oxidoreductase [Blastocatellia bacterium]